MKYLKVFTDFVDVLEPLSDAERGRLFTAMLKYAESGASPALSGNERFVWQAAKQIIDREESFLAKQRENGAKGGRPKNPTKPKETQPNPTKPSETQKSQKDKDKDKDNTLTGIPPYSPPKRGERFEVFWKAYPRKSGKDAARKAFAKRNPSQELLDKMLAAIEQQKQSAQWQKNGGQFIPLPTTWLNQGRWDDEVQITHSEPVAEDRYENLRRLYMEVSNEPAGNY